ncbi:MAG: DEAD/DEAH box helicase family protein [Chloroflexota bacterium]|nr:DEAD/DEAH box helicase family protein [Chloroflexota bacterium]
MKLLLKPFQIAAVKDLVTRLRHAARDARRGELQSVSLASPTGSGKTVMATAAIEALLEGDDGHAANPGATFLWVTDQPELNEQTRRKMLASSTRLGPAELVTLDPTFDDETFKPGTVYFLNIQKLGKEKQLITPGDRRSYTIWETIANTAAARPGSLYVFIDEAHRGMGQSQRARTEATTIIQKFILGSPGEIPAVPLIAGISATPERFNRLIEGTGRTSRQVVVPPEEVRASGLLKEVITLYHPHEDQPSDMTMLRAAARSWRAYCAEWSAYCQEQGEPMVEPILAVQVQDGSGKQLSRTDLAEALAAIREEFGPLPATAFAHAFQEGQDLSIGGQSVRYLAPADIDADPEVRVIFFKTSLNTGWDCPRAEVMMSFRAAADATLIAQLIGRMVRTPLARRIDANEHLNTVALYLPHYNAQELDRVIARLTAPDPDTMPPVAVKRGEAEITLRRAAGSENAFAALAAIPSYTMPKARKTSEVQRFMRLGRLLAHDGLDDEGPERATALLLAVLHDARATASATERFQQIVEEREKLTVRAVDWRLGADLDDDAETIELNLAAENVDDLFEAAGKKLGEGLHKAWWKARVTEDASSKDRAKLELIALCTDPAVVKKVEATAQVAVQQWLRDHQAAITALPEAQRQEYNEIRRLAVDPQETTITYPDAIEAGKGDREWPRHLYINDAATFPATFNKWETRVITEELAREDIVGWLRNPDRKPWSLRIPYRLGGAWHAVYPDFLIVRSVGGHLVVEILDPHLLTLEDAPAKAAGLAEYAAKHAYLFGRIELIIVDGNDVQRLDLSDERTRDRVRAVTTHEHLRQLFDSFSAASV